MKKASEYRLHARECRELAAKMALGDQRDQLLAMAENWDQLAAERAQLITNHPELAVEGEAAEEASFGKPARRPRGENGNHQG